MSGLLPDSLQTNVRMTQPFLKAYWNAFLTRENAKKCCLKLKSYLNAQVTRNRPIFVHRQNVYKCVPTRNVREEGCSTSGLRQATIWRCMTWPHFVVLHHNHQVDSSFYLWPYCLLCWFECKEKGMAIHDTVYSYWDQVALNNTSSNSMQTRYAHLTSFLQNMCVIITVFYVLCMVSQDVLPFKKRKTWEADWSDQYLLNMLETPNLLHN